MKYTFDSSWKEWIHHNIRQGCDKEGMVKILLKNDFYPELILNEMKYQPSSIEVLNAIREKTDTQLFKPSFLDQGSFHYDFLSEPKSNTNINNDMGTLDDVSLPFAKRIETDKVHMYVIDDFLTNKECDKVVARIRKKCRPSTITNSSESDTSFRTSKTCDLSYVSDGFIDDLDRRISDYMGYEVERAEGIQGQYYQEGDQFKTHTDYFEPDTQEYKDFANQMGQRTWTFMIYLNDVPEGGHTEFTKLGLKFRPKKGQAVTWNSIDEKGEVNPNTLHWAKPILKGEKFVITKWFRTQGSLINPFIPYLHNKIPALTNTGFKKIKLPDRLYAKIHQFYENNRVYAVTESDAAIGTFIHTKEKHAPSKMVELSDTLRRDIFGTVNPMLEDWCGHKLKNTAVYGIREYQEGATLDMHVDRYETHVLSMIINVEQEVNEEWPLYVYDHFYRLHKIILAPGEVVFYESAKIAHGRPEALKGKRYANIFAHTMPINWEERASGFGKVLETGRLQQKMKFIV